MIDIIRKSILKINSNAEFTFQAEDINTIEWLNGTTPIPKSDIENKMAELKTAYDNAEYQRNRASEYPSIADQLDDIYHNGIDAWKATIKTTKDKYPKG
ncbi:hypothetical protein OAM14_03720 [Candidatus Pelagibacter sp.]|nr:hypothetical protein [Candidatus Pelagibacter sp.]